MKKNKFMTRVFSAMENQETEVLDQIQNDLEIAKEDGELDSEEYKITWDPDQEVFVLHDKINNEHTEISEDEEAAFYMTDMTDANEGIPTPEESIPELSVNDEVKWTDELGHEHQGMITMISDGIATILENEVEVAAPIESLMKVEAPVEKVAEVDYTFSEKDSHDEEYCVVMVGGSIGDQKHQKYRLGGSAVSLVKDGLSADDAKEMAKRYRLRRTAGEKNYYKITYKAVPRSKVKEFSEKVEDYEFSFIEKEFSYIDSPESFREYAHKVMKEAHGDEYSEEVTNKVVDDLLADNPNNDYGELIGRLTSGFGEKEFSFSENGDERKAIVVRDRDYNFQIISIKSPKDEEKVAQMKRDGYIIDRTLPDSDDAKDYVKMRKEELAKRGQKGFSFIEKTFGMWDNEKSAVVLKNPDGTHEVVSIQSEDDEERLKSYKEEGCRVVKRCKNTGEADKYIEEKSLTRAYSFIEKTFAKSDAVKKLEFEVSRIKDMYDDAKSRQKGETDPVMKSRNKMLLQEIKVKLEQAKLSVYKKEFEESRSKIK